MINFFNFKRFCLSKKYYFHKCYKPYINIIQLSSFNNFIKYKKKCNYSIKKRIMNFFPIINLKKKIFLKIKKIIIKKPYYKINYIKKRNLHYFSDIYLLISIFFLKTNIKLKEKIFLGKIPFMTNRGSFIINGTERVLISQFEKSKGVYFIKENNFFICRIISNVEKWMEIILDNKVFFFFNKKNNFYFSEFLICIGIRKKFFFNFFFLTLKVKIIKGKNKIFLILNKKFFFYKKYFKFLCISFNKILEHYYGKYYLLNNFCILKFKNINLKNINIVLNKKFFFLYLIIIKNIINKNYLIKIYKSFYLKIHETNYFYNKSNFFLEFLNIFKKKFLIFESLRIKKRIKIFYKNILFYIELYNKILKFIKFNIEIDNFDNLENKNILSSGSLLSNKFNFLIEKISKILKFKLVNLNINSDLNLLIDENIITFELKDYFCNNELSQFLDQNNPLAEFSHYRKISLITGISQNRENCGFDIRDINYSQYAKICPVDTPEGHNIGLIASFAMYSKINKYNFISSIYKFCLFGKIIGIGFYDNKFEKNKFISNFLSTIKTIYGEIFKFPFLDVRKKELYYKKKFFLIDLIEISSDQIFSIGACLIPFLSYNDANRCLMGSNMQRQAVPLLKPDQALIGTGNELIIGLTSGYNIISKKNGIVIFSDNCKIIIKKNKTIKKYYLEQYSRTNQNTIFNQNNLTKIGSLVKKGEILADSNCTKNGEMSLGKNLKIGFMSWYGFNFEDSIVLSSKLLDEKYFTSIHIYEFLTILKYSENGEEILSENCFNELQIENKVINNGIIKIGEFVTSKDVIVGKMVPKDKQIITPEEKLFKIVFSDSNFNYYEQPLLVPKSINGIIIKIDDFKLYIFENKILKILKFQQLNYINKSLNNYFYETINFYLFKIKKLLLLNKVILNNKIKSIDININILLKIKCINKKINYKIKILKIIILNLILKIKILIKYKKKNILKYKDFEKSIIRIVKINLAMKKKIKIGDKLSGRYGNKGVVSNIVCGENMPYDKFGEPLEIILNPLGIPSRMNVGQLLEVFLGLSIVKINNIFLSIDKKKKNINKIKIILTFLFKYLFKKKINLNCLNFKKLLLMFNNVKNNIKVCVHNFEKLNFQNYKLISSKLGFTNTGKVLMFDGITGKRFLQLISIGYMYIMKLNHLVIDKIYSRSIGPYSLITQQPLGGKSNQGGQRLGEMEVWAIEAFGAANLLKEMLTVKSDDVYGRIKLYKNLMKGFLYVETGIPESFQVLIKEIQALCFDIKII